jgi:hypothetical protein
MHLLSFQLAHAGLGWQKEASNVEALFIIALMSKVSALPKPALPLLLKL